MVKLKGWFGLFRLLIPATVLGTGVQSIRQERSRSSAYGEAVRRESPTILPEETAALSQCHDQGLQAYVCDVQMDVPYSNGLSDLKGIGTLV